MGYPSCRRSARPRSRTSNSMRSSPISHALGPETVGDAHRTVHQRQGRHMKHITDKVAFVTGGASGIGLGMARVFLRNGMQVVIADIRADHLENAKQALDAGGSAHFIRLDITDRDAMKAAADEAWRVFGKVHVLC